MRASRFRFAPDVAIHSYFRFRIRQPSPVFVLADLQIWSSRSALSEDCAMLSRYECGGRRDELWRRVRRWSAVCEGKLRPNALRCWGEVHVLLILFRVSDRAVFGSWSDRPRRPSSCTALAASAWAKFSVFLHGCVGMSSALTASDPSSGISAVETSATRSTHDMSAYEISILNSLSYLE